MNYGNTLLELSSDWFLSSYNDSKDDLKCAKVTCDSDPLTFLAKHNGKGKYYQLFNNTVMTFENEIVEFDNNNSLFNYSINLLYDLFLLLESKMSIYSIKVEAIKEKFMLLQNSLRRMKFLHEKIHNFIEKTVIGPDLIDKINIGELDKNYCISLKYLLDKINSIQNTDIKRTNVGRELNLLYRSLFNIAINRIRYKLTSIFSNNESVFIILQTDYSKPSTYSELIKMSKIIKFLISNTTELGFFSEKYISFAAKLFSTVIKETKKLCENKDEIGVLITSKDYDKYQSTFFEREQILNNFYLLINEPMNESFFSTTKKILRIEEIFFESQKMIYKAFISIYEHSRQLFDNSLKDVLQKIFSNHLIEVMELFQTTILKTCDTTGLSILYNIILRFKCLSKSKLSVFENAIADSNVLFEYYKMQNKAVYSSLESSAINHIYSLSSLSNRDFIKSCVSDKLSRLNPITRRISELLMVITKLLDDPNNEKIRKLVSRIQSSIINWLVSSNEFLQNEYSIGLEQGCIFIINNVDAIISVLQGKKEILLDDFQHVFCEYTQKYIEHRFIKAYSNIQKIIDSKFRLNEINVQYINEVLEHFNKSWKKNIDIEFQTILTSFSNFHTSEEILRLLGTTTAMKYSQLMNIIKNEYKMNELLEKNEVDIEVILDYIQSCLYPTGARNG
ncbi:vacuolar sorting protein [Cryptosporidium ubiquitum]|uniref:Vacuolar sorting protein n=1 Tax=Cryptosporidium ubiquitum TaxID=857276 RepID=A0A1J4MD05_9CRYT|nr:vacuolar sorting protein [Cryptosporidium ubiquitum]OII72122.1 vacuolar sorting protein [Cryptosporidium ubiquitum]